MDRVGSLPHGSRARRGHDFVTSCFGLMNELTINVTTPATNSAFTHSGTSEPFATAVANGSEVPLWVKALFVAGVVTLIVSSFIKPKQDVTKS